MSRVAYIRAWPRDPATGAVGLVTMAGGGSHLPYLIGSTHYRAGVVREPRFAASLGFGETGWTGAVMPQISVIEFAPGDPALLRAYQALYWKDAPIEVDAGEETMGVGRILTGIIGDATVEGDRLLIAVADFGVKLAKPLIQSWFAGTGGIEGDATVEGRVKRRSFGAVLNVEGRILNVANNLYEFGDPAYPLQNFTAVRDMGRAGSTYLVEWQGSAAATLAALIAAPAQQGGGLVAPSIACVKWWTQPAGPLTADIQGENTGGYVETPVSIAARVLAAANGPAIVNQAAANAIRNFPAGLHIADDSETAASALDRLLLPVSLLWRFGTTGQIDVRPWDWSGSAEVVQGRYLGRTKTLAPTKTRRLGYARNHRQHSEGEIAADIIAAGVTYADGTTLEQLKPAEGGANITGNHSAAAFAGQGALATRNDVIFGSHVTSLPAAIDPSNLIGGNYLSAGFARYLDNVTVQALRPGEAGANITEARVASAVAGQGAFATLNSLAYGSPLLSGFGALASLSGLAFGSPQLTGFGSLAGLGNLFFGSPYLLEASGGAQASLSAFKTALGIASGFSGQGVLATMSGLSYGSPLLTGFGALSPLSNLFFGSNYLLEGAGGALATLANFKTAQGTAAAIAGQGPGATASAGNVLNSYVPLGGNSVILSNFQQGLLGTFGRGAGNFPPLDVSINLDTGPDKWFGARQVPFANFHGTLAQDNDADAFWTPGPWGGGTMATGAGRMLPVRHGDRVYARSLVARHRCQINFYALIFNEAGQLVAAPNWRGGRDGGAAGGLPSNFDELGACFSISDVVSAGDSPVAMMLMWRMIGTGEADPYMFITEPAMGKVAAGQTTLPPYVDGPTSPLADQTSAHTAAAFAGQGALATQSSLSFGSGFLTGFGGLAARDNLRLGINNGLLNETGSGWLTDGSVITSIGTAAAFAGQGALATRSALGWTDALFTGRPQYLTDVVDRPGFPGEKSLRSDYIVQAGSGVALNSRWPQEGGANVTEGRTAASFAGQGALATQSSLAFGGSFLTGFGGLAARDNLRLGNNNGLLNEAANGWLTDGSVITSNGTAAAIAGQGTFATRSALNLNSDDIQNRFADYLFYNVGGNNPSVASLRPGEAGSNVTEGRTAAAFAGQTSWATYTGLSTLTVEQRTQHLQTDGNYHASHVYNDDLLSNRWPQEGGANVTEGRIAAAFSGQGALATRSSVAFGSAYVTGFGGLASRDNLRLGLNNGLLNEGASGWLTDSSVITSNGTAAAISGQGPGATAAAGSVLNSYVPLGGNSVVLSNFRQGLSATMARGTGTYGQLGVGINLDTGQKWFGARQVPFANWAGTLGLNDAVDAWWTPGPWGGGSMATGAGRMLPVRHGDRAYARSLVARHRCQVDFYALIFNQAAQLVGAAMWRGGRLGGADGGFPSNFDELGACFNISDVVAGGDAPVAMILMWRMIGTGEDQPYMFMTEPAMGKVAAGQTSLPPYVDGPASPLADQTSANTAAGFSGQGAFATQSYLNLDNSSYFQQPSRFYASEYGAQYFSASAISFSAASGGSTLQSLRPGEANANVTEGRTAAAFAGQSQWATYTALSTTLVEQRTQFLQTDGNYHASHVYNDDLLSNRWPQEGGSNKTESRTAAAFSGQGALATRSALGWTDDLFTGRPQYLTDVVDRPGYPGEKSLRSDYVIQPGSNVALVNRWPQEAGANVTEARTASGIAGQGAFATQSWINSGNVSSFFAYSAFRLSYNITRFDGSTVVTETMVLTSEGISAGFVGQGLGATANNLAQLDPTAQGDINSLKGGKSTFGFGEIKKVVLQPGASINISGSVGVNAGGGNGNIRAQLSAGPSGGTKSVFANGEQAAVAPGEPGLSPVSGIFTNSSSTPQLFEITLSVLRTPSGAGGSIDSAQSYFT